ncbi:MAG: DUF624 domain-containing protein [Clostridia bacterium]|nr:DUF624 domain-containing protein [Clostridia bacterium]
MKNKEKKKFKLFDSQREGRGVEKTDVYTKTDLKGFFIKYKLYFTRLLSVNLLMVLGNFPLIFAAIAMSTLTRVIYFAPSSPSFPILFGILGQQREPSAFNLMLMGIEGVQYEASAMTTTTYVLFALSALVIFTFGIVNVGTTYILRNMVKGDPVFIFSDFAYAVRRNWKQALPFGILDAILLFLIPFDIVYLLSTPSGIFGGIMLGITVVFALLYFWMRFYIYIQMVTFDLSIKKILKNSLIFALVGFKRNIMATLGIVILVAINLALAIGFYGVLSAAAILFPVVLLFSNGAFMSTYAAYFKIKEIMIDPYEAEKQPDVEDTGLPEAE